MLYDLIVIGSGPAGQKAALQGARAGKRVAIVDDLPMLGGACLHWGTMPSKSFRESVYRWSLSSRGTLGRESEELAGITKRKLALPDMKRLLRRKERVVDGEAHVIRERFESHGIRVYPGRARLLSAHDVEVRYNAGSHAGEVQKIAGSTIIIATGAHPVSKFEVDGQAIHDSNTILSLKKVPKSIIVLGAGITGLIAGYGLEYWSSVIAYPLNIGGRPLHSWVAFIPPATMLPRPIIDSCALPPSTNFAGGKGGL